MMLGYLRSVKQDICFKSNYNVHKIIIKLYYITNIELYIELVMWLSKTENNCFVYYFLVLIATSSIKRKVVSLP